MSRARHESLADPFRTIDGQPTQVVAPGLTLRSLHGPRRLFRSRRRRPQAGPRRNGAGIRFEPGALLRPHLMRFSPTTDCSGAHHAPHYFRWLVDGCFHARIWRFTEPFARAKARLAELPIQYGDFALWQRRTLEGTCPGEPARLTGGGTSPAWSRPWTCPPTAPGRPAQPGRRLPHWSLPAGLTQELRALSRHAGTTLFTTLLAGFLPCCTARPSATTSCVGTPIAGRTPGGTGRVDRLLREQPGAARRPLRRSDLPRAAGAGTGNRAGRFCAPGRPFRNAGRAAPAEAGPQPKCHSSR